MKQHLDFVIIGAQKAGTTSLHKYLGRHPHIVMPPEKEAYFFSHDDRYARGPAWFYEEFYQGARPDALWGKATPQYMADPVVPARMAASLPDVRLVALLRNPIDRAFSHYQMCVRRGWEQRGFTDALVRLRHEQGVARRLRVGPRAETRCYLVWGEYGRILHGYLDYFSRHQLKVVFTEDLQRNPAGVVDEVTDFLGLGTGFRPDNLGRRYHRGGSREWVPWLRPLSRWPPFRSVWLRVPNRMRRYIAFWVNVANTRRGGDVPQPAPDVRNELVEYFKGDVEVLRGILAREPPWPEFACERKPPGSIGDA